MYLFIFTYQKDIMEGWREKKREMELAQDAKANSDYRWVWPKSGARTECRSPM